MDIRIDNLSHPGVQALLQLHFFEVHRQTAGESRRILGLSQLAQSDMTMFCAWGRVRSDGMCCITTALQNTRSGKVNADRRRASNERYRESPSAACYPDCVVSRLFSTQFGNEGPRSLRARCLKLIYRT